MTQDNSRNALPVLPLKSAVLFPHWTMPVSVGRPGSLAAVEAALSSEEKEMIVVSQRDASVEAPSREDLYSVGTRIVVKRVVRPTEGAIQMMVQGVERVSLVGLVQEQPFMIAETETMPLASEESPEIEALRREIVELLKKAFSIMKSAMPLDLGQLLGSEGNAVRDYYVLSSIISLDLEKEQSLLEAQSLVEGYRTLHAYLAREVQVYELRHEISAQAEHEMTKQQREYYLRQQLQAIQEELGEGEGGGSEVEELARHVAELDLPEQVRKEADRELTRLRQLPVVSPEHSIVRGHLEFILELPWTAAGDPEIEIRKARRVLDEGHYGLKDVKERILEHLGVLKLNPTARSPILCFVGAPGVGKTSLGQSIADAIDRKFERMSLGGMHDESELRGHRRTYIGAMPGRILQAIRRTGVVNPVLMLDEVDKLGRDFRGDPAAALLEILDPEQNREFRDNFLDLPYDLSHVFFITTANTLETIPGPLRDRMEIIRLPGYSDEEKQEIAKRYLIPRQLRETGLSPGQCEFGDDALKTVIDHYTREAGVRQLNRSIGKVLRKVALQVVEGDAARITIESSNVDAFLGPPRFFRDQAREELPAGVAAGLAWTETGGEVLYVEATLLPEGKGLTLTGQLGDVMQESARAAQSYIWSHMDDLRIEHGLFKDAGVHIHVPAGAIPKDGPSAGITMATALASLYMRRPVRSDTAMTGEITLTGLVLPVGGVKEKVLAARRAGMRRVILSQENRKDLRDLPDRVRQEMEFVFARKIEDVLEEALEGSGEPLPLQTVG